MCSPSSSRAPRCKTGRAGGGRESRLLLQPILLASPRGRLKTAIKYRRREEGRASLQPFVESLLRRCEREWRENDLPPPTNRPICVLCGSEGGRGEEATTPISPSTADISWLRARSEEGGIISHTRRIYGSARRRRRPAGAESRLRTSSAPLIKPLMLSSTVNQGCFWSP